MGNFEGAANGWAPRRHKLARHHSAHVRAVIEQNARAVELQNCVERAEALVKTERAKAVGDEPKWPSNSADMTPEWLDTELERRRTVTDRDERVQLALQMRYHAYEAQYRALERIGDRFIVSLADDLDALMVRVRDAVSRLSPRVCTSDDAFAAGQHETWAALTDMARDYQEIRHVQVDLYGCRFAHMDRELSGYGNPKRAKDDEAFFDFHRDIAAVAPNWLGSTVRSGDQLVHMPAEVPWPSKLVEKLVWFGRNDSGAWCPTSDEIAAALEERRPRVDVPDMFSHPVIKSRVDAKRPSDVHRNTGMKDVDQSGSRFADVTARNDPAKPHNAMRQMR